MRQAGPLRLRWPVTRPRTPFGRQESVTSGGKIISRSVYDGFDHVVESQKMDGTGAARSPPEQPHHL